MSSDAVFISSVPSFLRPYIIDNKMGFAPNNSPREYDYSEREEVLFELKEGTNPKTGKPIFFAINVRPAND
jgi:hypothetical protein